MAHELDFSRGHAAIAFAGKDVPWHGYGNAIEKHMSPEEICKAAYLDFEVMKSPVEYEIANPNFNKAEKVSETNPLTIKTNFENRAVVYRSDTGDALSVMSENSYTPAQPIELINGLFEVTKGSGFSIDVVGALRGGKVVWALAKRDAEPGQLGSDIILPYVLLKTSYDGSYARAAAMTSVRVVCANTLGFSAQEEKRTGKITKQRNSSEFTLEKANQLFDKLGEFDNAFKTYMETMRAMTQVKMTDNKLARFFTRIYAPDAWASEEHLNNWTRAPMSELDNCSTNKKNTIQALLDLVRDNPGSNLPSANGTLFGALQTVTYFQDHAARSKEENGLSKRWESATIGQGARMKADALELATSLIS